MGPPGHPHLLRLLPRTTPVDRAAQRNACVRLRACKLSCHSVTRGKRTPSSGSSTTFAQCRLGRCLARADVTDDLATLANIIERPSTVDTIPQYLGVVSYSAHTLTIASSNIVDFGNLLPFRGALHDFAFTRQYLPKDNSPWYRDRGVSPSKTREVSSNAPYCQQ